MKKMIHIRNSIIIILCITIICLGIGFMILSIKLKNISEEEHIFSVVFTKIEKSSSIRGAKIDPTAKATITPNGSKAEMSFLLNSPHDEVSYILTIKNTGNIKAEITDIFESPDYSDNELNKLISPVTISTSDFIGKVIAPDDEINVKITAYYNTTDKEIKPIKFNYNLAFNAKSVN